LRRKTTPKKEEKKDQIRKSGLRKKDEGWEFSGRR
jgi:hypothetical protein